MKRTRIAPKRSTEYSRTIGGVGGIAAGEAPVGNKTHFELLENMYVDYKSGGDAIESFPGFRRLLSLDGKIKGIYKQRTSDGEGYLIIRTEGRLYRIKAKELEENVAPTEIAQLLGDKGNAFGYGGDFYYHDGNRILRVNDAGEAIFIGEAGAEAYIPTIYDNEVKKEDRNLLYNRGIQRFKVRNTEDHLYGSPGLKYTVTDESKRLCKVSGYSSISSSLYIPPTTKINGRTYKITDIEDYAFKDCRVITYLYTNDNLLRIGRGAFFGCTNIETAIIAGTVTEILDEAFINCINLTLLSFNHFPVSVGYRAFAGCGKLTSVKCHPTTLNFSSLMSGTGLDGKTPEEAEPIYDLTLQFRLHGPVTNPYLVTVEGVKQMHTFDKANMLIKLSFKKESEYLGKEIVVNCALDPYDYSDDGGLFNKIIGNNRFEGKEALFGCTASAVFDGRIFLSGNPLLPGVVFYSQSDPRESCLPLYFGCKNILTDGESFEDVVDLLPVGDRLFVLLAGRGTKEGSVCIHKARQENGQVKYPAIASYGGSSALSFGVSYLGEALFVTDMGLSALESINGSRQIMSRSVNISSLLLKERLSEATVSVWMGYIVVCVGGSLYLADTRDIYTENRVRQYEWYRITDVGTYRNDRRVYRYSGIPRAGYKLSDKTDQIATGTVISSFGEDGLVYYTEMTGERILVYPTDEFTDGDFYPVSAMLADGELLYFGTSAGDLCIFNTDKRGVAPDRIARAEGFSPEEYETAMGDRIHPDFYSFDSHRINYRILYPFDDCGVPHLTKSTVRGSLVIRFKCFEGGRVRIYTETENGKATELGELSLSETSFDGIDFSAYSAISKRQASVRLPEYERGWTEKRFSLASCEYCSPFGVYSLSYRYKIKGNIKN